MNRRKKTQAVSSVEYISLIVFFIAALIVMRKPMVRVFFGRWKALGDSFSQGEQYDPQKTVECVRVSTTSLSGIPVEEFLFQPAFDCCMNATQNSDCTGTDDWGVVCYEDQAISAAISHSGSDKVRDCFYGQIVHLDCWQEKCLN